MDIKLDTGVGGNQSGAKRPGITDQEAVAIWDRLTNSRLVLFHQETGKPIAGRRYRLEFEDGRTISGVTDEHGRTELVTSDAMGKIDFTIYPPEETA
jgi:uncharacterized protein (DUF2345 family)